MPADHCATRRVDLSSWRELLCCHANSPSSYECSLLWRKLSAVHMQEKTVLGFANSEGRNCFNFCFAFVSLGSFYWTFIYSGDSGGVSHRIQPECSINSTCICPEPFGTPGEKNVTVKWACFTQMIIIKVQLSQEKCNIWAAVWCLNPASQVSQEQLSHML